MRAGHRPNRMQYGRGRWHLNCNSFLLLNAGGGGGSSGGDDDDDDGIGRSFTPVRIE